MSGSVGVCGFGRCGSTMVMAMLDAGGLPPVEGSWPGSYEVADSAATFALTPDQLAGRAVKLLDAPYAFGAVPYARSWGFVWLDRDPVQQARSHRKLGAALGMDGIGEVELVASYAADRPTALGVLRRHGFVLVLRYENVLANPVKAAKRLRRVFGALDVRAAAAVVHDRDGACRPDLSVELGSAS